MYLTIENFFDCYVETYDTVNDIKERLLRFLEVPEELFRYFSLYEQLETEYFFEETFISSKTKVTDILASWEFDINTKGDRLINRYESYLNNQLNYIQRLNKIFLKPIIFSDDKYEDIFDIFALIDFINNFYKNYYRMDIYSLYDFCSYYLVLTNKTVIKTNEDQFFHNIQKMMSFFDEHQNFKERIDMDKFFI